MEALPSSVLRSSLTSSWLAVFVVLGGFSGCIYHSLCPQVFASTVVVSIEPGRQIVLCRGFGVPPQAESGIVVRHDRMITQPIIVERCLNSDLGLMNLPSFDAVPQDEIVSHVIKNLKATPDREAPDVFELEYRSNGSTDARAIVNHLIETYRQYLDEQLASELTSASGRDKAIENKMHELGTNSPEFAGWLKTYLPDVKREYRFAILKNARFGEVTSLGPFARGSCGVGIGLLGGIIILAIAKLVRVLVT